MMRINEGLAVPTIIPTAEPAREQPAIRRGADVPTMLGRSPEPAGGGVLFQAKSFFLRQLAAGEKFVRRVGKKLALFLRRNWCSLMRLGARAPRTVPGPNNPQIPVTTKNKAGAPRVQFSWDVVEVFSSDLAGNPQEGG